MKLLFNQKIIEFEHPPSVEEVIENINKLLQKNYYFSHFNVDGNEITVSPEEYLERYIDEVTTIEVIAIEAKIFVNDLILSAENYVQRATPEVVELADNFYHSPTPDNWIELNDLFEGIQWLSIMIATIDESIVQLKNWDEVVVSIKQLQDELKNLEEALDNSDIVLIADMLQYEVVPVFETLMSEFKLAIDNEGIREQLS